MRVRTSMERGGRPTGVGVSGLIVVALGLGGILGACSSGDANSAASSSSTSAPDMKIEIAPTGESINPSTPIVVKVSDGTLSTVTMTNSTKGNQVKGAISADKKSWTSGEALAYGTSYSIVADAVNSAGKQGEQKSMVSTLSPKSTQSVAFTPAPNDNGSFGVGQIIGVSFDQNVTDPATVEKALAVTSTPSQPGSWFWIDKKTAHYRPQSYWKAGTTIQLDAKLYGVNLGGGVYGEADRSATYKVHDSWVAKADGSTKQMQIFHDGQMVKSMPVSLGSTTNPTHVGPHVVSEKQQELIMDSCTYGLCPPSPGAYKAKEYWDVRISNDGEFVHENPNSVAQQGYANVSHGCINLNADNAQWFFNNFNLGDVVEVTNSGGLVLPTYDTYGDWELTWPEWQVGSALHG